MTANTKRPVECVLVKQLNHVRTDRGMTLIEHASRCMPAGEIHELVTCDEAGRRPGDRIERVGFLGFGEVLVGGVVERGDAVFVGTQRIGTVLGFDECHHPNHYNVVIKTERLSAGPDLDLRVGDRIRFGAAEESR